MGWGPIPSPSEVVDAVTDVADTAIDVGSDVASFGADLIQSAGNAAFDLAESAFNGVRAIGDWVGQYSELLSMIINPLGFLTGEVAGYIISNIDWIKDPIDLMKGDGSAVEDLANEWVSISEALTQTSQNLVRGAQSSSESWEGDAGEKYRKVARAFAEMLGDAAALSTTAADRISTMGSLVAEARGEVIEMVCDCLEKCVQIMLGALAASIISLGTAIAGGVAAIVNEAVSTMNEIKDRLEQLKGDVEGALQGLSQVEQGFQTMERDLVTAAANIRNPGSAETGGGTPSGGGRPSGGGGGGPTGGGGGPTGGGGGGPTGGGGGGPSGGGGGGPAEPEEPDEPEQPDEPGPGDEEDEDDSDVAVTDLPDGSKVLHPYLAATIPESEWRAMAESIPPDMWEAIANDHADSIPPELAAHAPEHLRGQFPSNAPDWEPPVDANGYPKPVGGLIPEHLVDHMTPGMDQAIEDFDMEEGEEAWEQANYSEEQLLRSDLEDAETDAERVEILQRLDELHQQEDEAGSDVGGNTQRSGRGDFAWMTEPQ